MVPIPVWSVLLRAAWTLRWAPKERQEEAELATEHCRETWASLSRRSFIASTFQNTLKQGTVLSS